LLPLRVVWQGTSGGRLAECLGLDPSKYGGGGASVNSSSSMAAALRDEALQVSDAVKLCK
jgi:hypothetical protein